MSLERAFRLSSILMAVIGFASLVMTQELPLVLVALGAGALTAGVAAIGGGARRGSAVPTLCSPNCLWGCGTPS